MMSERRSNIAEATAMYAVLTNTTKKNDKTK